MKKLLLRTLGLILLLGSAFFLGRRTAPQVVEKGGVRTQVIAGKTGGDPGNAGARAGGSQKAAKPLSKNWSPLTCPADALLKRLFEEPGMYETQYLLYRSIEEASPELLVEWAGELAAMPATRSWQPEALRSVAKRWAELDATAALNWAQGLPPAQGKSAMAAVLGGITGQDPGRASAMAQGLPAGPSRNAALIAVADVLRKSDPVGALTLLGDLKNYEAQTVIREAFATWAQSDPGSAAAAAAKMPANNNGYDPMHSVYNSWALQDPLAALASMGSLPKGNKRNKAMSTALNSWAQRDPAAALAYCQALPDKDQRGGTIGTILGVMIKTDPQRAIAALDGLPAKARLGSISSLASSWADADVGGALAWAKNLTSEKERATAMGGLAAGVAVLDPAHRQSIIDGMPEGNVRNTFLSNLINHTASSDPVGAAKMLESMEPHAQQKALRETSLLSYLNEADPEVGFRLAAAMPGSDHYQVSRSLGAIAARDPAKAEKLALSLEPDQQKNVLPGLYGGMAQSDGPGALAKARGLADGTTRKNAMASVFSSWASSDADAVLAWAKTADPVEKNQALSSAIQIKAYQDPGAAAKLTDALLQSATKETQGTAAGVVVSVSAGLFQENPQGAVRWVAGLPVGDLHDQGISTLASQWVNSDPVEASVWIRSLPGGPSKDKAVGQLINGIQQSDPTSALAWAGSIADESSRSSHMQSLFQTWIQNDKTAALEALKTAPLSDATRESIRQNTGQ